MTLGPIERKQRAEQLLADDLFQEAFTAVEKAIVDRLKSGATDKDAEWLLSLRLMAKIKQVIIGYAQSGKLEAFEEEQRKK